MPWFKLWTNDKLKRTTVAGSSVEEIIQKGSQNLGITGHEIALEDGSKIVDSDILNSMTNGTLLILLERSQNVYVEPANTSNQPSTSSGTSGQKLSVQSIKEKLQSIRRKRLDRCSMKLDEPATSKKRKQKETYKVTFGLMSFVNGEVKYVMPRRGGGAKKETIQKGATYDDILKIAKELYNMEEDSDCYLGSYDGQQLDKNITCSQFVKKSNFVTLPRIYLIKRESTHSSEDNSTSDDEGHRNEQSYENIPDELYELQIEIEAEEEMKSKDLPDSALESVDSKNFLSVYARSPVAQLFVDEHASRGKKIEKIDTGYGPFFLIPKEDVAIFDKCSAKYMDDPRNLHILDDRLRWWVKKRDIKVKRVSENVAELNYSDDIDFQVFIEGLVSEIKA